MLLHLMSGSKADAETVTAFFQGTPARSLSDPLLVVSDGAPGVVTAIETCFPRSERQRCPAHRLRNLAAKAPEDLWPEFKARATATSQATSRASRATDFGRRQMAAIRKELDQEYQARNGRQSSPSAGAPQDQLSRTSRT